MLLVLMHHLVLQVYNLRQLLHGSGVEVVEEEGLGVVPWVRTVDELRLDEPLHGSPCLVDAVLECRAYGWRENIDAVKAAFTIVPDPDFAEEAL
mgnify:CR=1 FL=1